MPFKILFIFLLVFPPAWQSLFTPHHPLFPISPMEKSYTQKYNTNIYLRYILDINIYYMQKNM